MVKDDNPPLQLHIEPEQPIEVTELTNALAALARQFEIYAVEESLTARAKDAKLLVTSVRPGSIDIGLWPDFATLGTLLAPLMPLDKVLGFATKLKGLVDAFKTKPPTSEVTVRDCEDVGAIMAPIAHNGGTQTFNVFNGTVYHPVLHVTGEEALQALGNAARAKALIQHPAADARQHVAMVWAGLDTDPPRAAGVRSPDKARIDEIDPKPRPVFFDDEFAFLKAQMLDGVENPYRKVYFVDVTVSTVDGKVTSYKIIGFHGTADRDDGDPPMLQVPTS